jgi:DNA-binding LytR/AlgR family response regulator
LLIVSLCLELLASVSAMLIIIKFGISKTGPLVTDVFTLAMILYFVVLVKSFILLIKHYFMDQGAIQNLEDEQRKREKGFLMVKSRRKDVRIVYERLDYIESLSDYTCFHMEGGQEIRSRLKISYLEKELPGNFLRIHRSFVVNKDRITSFNREEIHLGDAVLPVSRTYRRKVGEELGKNA